MDNFIKQIDILDESKDCFLTYSEEVLTDRAIPAAEDGLLSAQRKILWTMNNILKMDNKSKTKKSASIVGSTLASAYFHGDASCYGVLCKMAQPYLMRYPLIEGQGSLGTQEANGMQSSARYTEAKPAKFADLMFNDYKKKVIPLKETYNGEYMEPVVLPSLFPNALVNGREAIGISMSTNSLPNNLTEVCNGIIAYIEKRGDITIQELMEHIPGPDFPLGGTVINAKDITTAFSTGKSTTSLKVRGDYIVEGNQIIFTTIPYRTYRVKIKEAITKNIDIFEKYLDDFNDESGLGENRLVFTLKKGVNQDVFLNQLFSLTPLQTTLSYNMNFIVDGTPKQCSLKDLIQSYVKHQLSVLINATEYDKEKVEARIHILNGLIAAIDKINEVIELIKTAENKADATEKLINFLSIDKVQAEAILDMKLARLTKIDKNELIQELADKKALLVEYNKILTDEDYRYEILTNKIAAMREKYGDERRTKLENIDFVKYKKEKLEDIIEAEDCIVNVSKSGLIKRIPVSSYHTQKRKGAGIKNNDNIVAYTIKTNTLDTLMVFTSAGKMYRILVNDIPAGTNASKGVPVTSLVNFDLHDTPVAYASLYYKTTAKYVFFATANGTIKKVNLEDYNSTKRKTGIAAIKLKDDDYVAKATFIEDEEMLMITQQGYVIRFKTADVPVSSRTAMGVKGMKLAAGDKVITCIPIKHTTDNLMLLTETGFGKQIPLTDVSVQNRAGKGSYYYKGQVVIDGCLVDDTDELLITGNKTAIKIAAKEIPTLTKTALGVSLIKNNTKVVSLSKI